MEINHRRAVDLTKTALFACDAAVLSAKEMKAQSKTGCMNPKGRFNRPVSRFNQADSHLKQHDSRLKRSGSRLNQADSRLKRVDLNVNQPD
jgi:hypothetical protein